VDIFAIVLEMPAGIEACILLQIPHNDVYFLHIYKLGQRGQAVSHKET